MFAYLADQLCGFGFDLVIDPNYQVPGIFWGMAAEGTAVQAFHEFHGLRAVVADGWWFSGVAEKECLNVFLAADGDSSGSNPFSGQIRGGYAADAC